MEGWGKALDTPSVPCLSELILHFEGDCDFFLSFLRLKPFRKQIREKRDSVLFFFYCVIPTAVYYFDVFI